MEVIYATNNAMRMIEARPTNTLPADQVCLRSLWVCDHRPYIHATLPIFVATFVRMNRSVDDKLDASATICWFCIYITLLMQAFCYRGLIGKPLIPMSQTMEVRKP